jgi:hypothetical protein
MLCPARARTAADAVRLRQWWTALCLDVSVTVAQQGQALDLESVPAGEYGHRFLVDVDITVAASVDSDAVSVPPTIWWTNWLDRLPDVLRRLGFALASDQQIVAVDEASDTRRVLSA